MRQGYSQCSSTHRPLLELRLRFHHIQLTVLGKILRIDVSVPLTYSSPPTNPFYGATPGRDEIFAYGMRNPWRFSFDRVTGAQWVADVGQGAREEVDTPIVSGVVNLGGTDTAFIEAMLPVFLYVSPNSREGPQRP